MTTAGEGGSRESGARVGGWTLDWRLGSGAGGDVFRARHDDGRVGALKFARPGAAARLAREADLLAILRHPAFPELYGRLPGGYAMAWIAGRRLDAVAHTWSADVCRGPRWPASGAAVAGRAPAAGAEGPRVAGRAGARGGGAPAGRGPAGRPARDGVGSFVPPVGETTVAAHVGGPSLKELGYAQVWQAFMLPVLWEEATLDRIDETELMRMFRTNTFSVFYLARDGARAGMRWMTIIGSTAGQRGEPKHPAYAASKATLGGMAHILAQEMGPKIRFNLISPGWVKTPMIELQMALGDREQRIAKSIPTGRPGMVEDCAAAARSSRRRARGT